MNNWQIGGLLIHIHPLFWVVMLGAVWMGYFVEVITLFTLVIIHELGHVFMAKSFAWKIRRIQLLPFGGVAEVEEWGNTMPREELWVALAGPFLNGVMWLVGLIFWQTGLWAEEWARYFMWCNLIIAGFNLLPVWPLDGGKIVQALLSISLPYRRSIRLTLWLSFVGVLIMLFIAISSHPLHLNLLIVGGYLLLHNVMDYRNLPYQWLRFLLMKYRATRNAKGFQFPSACSFITPHTRIMDSLQLLRKGRYHHFCIVDGNDKVLNVVSEQEMLTAYFEKNQPQCAVSDIFM